MGSTPDLLPAGTVGPVVNGTLVAKNIAEVKGLYCQHLQLETLEEGELTPELAEGWGMPSLAGSRYCILSSKTDAPWLRLIEQSDAAVPKPLSALGWMSLEVLVSDVQQVADRLVDSPFTMLGEPKALDVNDAIEACQFAGPLGEVYYLTSVSGPVPPFDMPMPAALYDRLFIPVLAVPDRAQALDVYGAVCGAEPLAFDTRATVLNKALGRPMEQRYPIASIQLQGQSFIEIDEVDAFGAPERCASGLANGIGCMTFEVDSLAAITAEPLGPIYRLPGSFYQNRPTQAFQGPAGELVELIER